MKERLDILATMVATLDKGDRDRRISPQNAVDGIIDIKCKLEAMYASFIIVDRYLNRKDKRTRRVDLRRSRPECGQVK